MILVLFRKLFLGIRLLVFFHYELVLANFRVAYDVIRPLHRLRPGVVAVPLDLKSGAGISLLSSFITLTPGTLSLDVSFDRKVLYVHTVNARDPEELRRSIKETFERPIMELLA